MKSGITRMLNNLLFPRPLKKVQMQGGARYAARGVLGSYVAAPHPSSGWVPGAPTPQIGLFQRPTSEIGWRSGRQVVQGAKPAASACSREANRVRGAGSRVSKEGHVGRQYSRSPG